MDDLQYSYSGNQLQAVSDVAPSAGVEDFTDVAGATDYVYDANGNLVSDANKGVTVSYNELNLPILADFGQGRRIAWLYDASGRKLRKRVTDGTAEPLQINQRDYAGGFVYQDGDLEFFATSEGRVVPDGSGFRYEYFCSDQHGSVMRRTLIGIERARAGLDDSHGFKAYYYGKGTLNRPYEPEFPNFPGAKEYWGP